jgi:hypothetical protein
MEWPTATGSAAVRSPRARVWHISSLSQDVGKEGSTVLQFSGPQILLTDLKAYVVPGVL